MNNINNLSTLVEEFLDSLSYNSMKTLEEILQYDINVDIGEELSYSLRERVRKSEEGIKRTL